LWLTSLGLSPKLLFAGHCLLLLLLFSFWLWLLLGVALVV
jgi:hypothetical protein